MTAKKPTTRKTATTRAQLVPAFGAHEIAAIAALDNTSPRQLSPRDRAEIVRLIRSHISHYGYMPDGSGNYFDVIEAVAKVLDGKAMTRADERLEAIDTFLDQHATEEQAKALGESVNVASERYSPNIKAALHVGLALGVALIYNGGVRR